MKTDLLFEKPNGWGLRGDPYLWGELKLELDSEITPSSADAFQKMIFDRFNKLTGNPISINKDIYVERYAHGGMSSGMVCIEKWREYLIPLLVTRFKALLNDKYFNMIVDHKFKSHVIDKNTQILIVGTFNPDYSGNNATFFYGRGRNYLWKLLPTALGHPDLKPAELAEKKDFMKKSHVDFIDLIASVDVDDPGNYEDRYLDTKVSEWNDVLSIINSLPYLKKVCFTRKTFNDIPNISKKIEEIRDLCQSKNISFFALASPARYYNNIKQNEWSNVLRS